MQIEKANRRLVGLGLDGSPEAEDLVDQQASNSELIPFSLILLHFIPALHEGRGYKWTGSADHALPFIETSVFY